MSVGINVIVVIKLLLLDSFCLNLSVKNDLNV